MRGQFVRKKWAHVCWTKVKAYKKINIQGFANWHQTLSNIVRLC